MRRPLFHRFFLLLACASLVAGCLGGGTQEGGWRFAAAGGGGTLGEADAFAANVTLPTSVPRIEGRYTGSFGATHTLRYEWRGSATLEAALGMGLACKAGEGPAVAGEAEGYGYTIRPFKDGCGITLALGGQGFDGDALSWQASGWRGSEGPLRFVATAEAHP